jgi:FSR family fosmidomycin resistance protein-like MFS transporter
MLAYGEPGFLKSVKSRSLVFTSLAHFINDGGAFTMPLIISILASERTVSSLTIIMMPVAFYSASLILSMLVGALADRTGRPGLMISTGLAIISAGLFGLAISLSLANGPLLSICLLLSAFLTGIGTAFYHPIGAAMLQSAYGDRSKGRALGINGAMGSLGRAVYPTLFFFVASKVTNNGSIAFLALVGVAASAIVSIGLRRGRQSSSLPSDPNRTGTTDTLRSRITMPLVILTFVAFVSTFSIQGVAAWIPTYLALQKGLGISSSLGFALTGMYAASIVSQPFFGYLVDRFQKKRVLAFSIAGCALSIFGYLVSSGILDVVLLVFLGFFTFSNFPIFLSLASDYVPKRSSSLSNALVWSLGVNGGGVVGPAVVGAFALSGYASWSTAFGLMAVTALLAAAMTGLLRKPVRELDLERKHWAADLGTFGTCPLPVDRTCEGVILKTRE